LLVKGDLLPFASLFWVPGKEEGKGGQGRGGRGRGRKKKKRGKGEVVDP